MRGVRRVRRVRQRFGLTLAQAGLLPGLVFGEGEA
jgi:hypothetical protein